MPRKALDAAVLDCGPRSTSGVAAMTERAEDWLTRRRWPSRSSGRLLGASVCAVFLALNPGVSHPEFQHRDGIFAEEIRQLGSYHAWAAGWPYLRHPPAGQEWAEPVEPSPPRVRATVVRGPDALDV
jgi:hypothetical protein